MRETVDRLRQSQEENEMISRRRDELEARVSTLEADYEELLGVLTSCQVPDETDMFLDRENNSRRGS